MSRTARRASLLGLLLIASQTPLSAESNDGWIPFELKNGHISVPSRVGGLAGYSIIDTGASGVAINESVAERLDLKVARNKIVNVTGVTGTQRRVVYKKVPAHLFGADLTFTNVTDMSLGRGNLQLLVGGPILQKFLFQFDYHNQKMRALPRDSVDLKSLSNIPSKRDSRGSKLPVVQVSLNNQAKLWLNLDTGNGSGLLISREVAKKHGWLDEYNLTNGFIAGVNGMAQTESFVLPELTFGPFELEHVLVTVPAQGVKLPAVQRSRQLAEGLLGYDILKHFVVTIDYRKGHIHVGLPQET